MDRGLARSVGLPGAGAQVGRGCTALGWEAQALGAAPAASRGPWDLTRPVGALWSVQGSYPGHSKAKGCGPGFPGFRPEVVQEEVRGRPGPHLHTQRRGEPLWLVVVHHGHTHCVQGHHAQHHPVEALRLHHAPDEEPEHLLLPTEVRRALCLPALEAGTSEGGSWGDRGLTEDVWGPVGPRTDSPYTEMCPMDTLPPAQASPSINTPSKTLVPSLGLTRPHF